MLKVATALPNEPYREYKDVERVYSNSTEIDKILDKNGNVLFAVNKEVEGTPALTYKGKEETNLKNYRIYGQTSRNLFDKNLCIEHAVLSPNGNVNIADANAASVSDFIPVTSNNSYTISNTGSIRGKYYKGDYSAYQVSDFDFQPNQNSNTFVIPESVKYIRFTIMNTVGVESVMLCEGSTFLPYEPYGESVGDRTGNLFDMSTIVEGKYISSSGIEVTSTTLYQESRLNYMDFINVSNDTVYSLTCTMPYSIALGNTIAFCWFDDNKSLISRDTKQITGDNISSYSFSAISPLNATYLIINFIGYVDGTTYMLTTGSTALPYEPYGYKVPMTISNGTDTQTTPIYLPEPIKMVGDEAEYIDYAEQKMHRIGADDIDVTLPAISTLAGTNTLTVGTEVQPSNVYLKGRIKEAST